MRKQRKGAITGTESDARRPTRGGAAGGRKLRKSVDWEEIRRDAEEVWVAACESAGPYAPLLASAGARLLRSETANPSQYSRLISLLRQVQRHLSGEDGGPGERGIWQSEPARAVSERIANKYSATADPTSLNKRQPDDFAGLVLGLGVDLDDEADPEPGATPPPGTPHHTLKRPPGVSSRIPTDVPGSRLHVHGFPMGLGVGGGRPPPSIWPPERDERGLLEQGGQYRGGPMYRWLEATGHLHPEWSGSSGFVEFEVGDVAPHWSDRRVGEGLSLEERRGVRFGRYVPAKQRRYEELLERWGKVSAKDRRSVVDLKEEIEELEVLRVFFGGINDKWGGGIVHKKSGRGTGAVLEHVETGFVERSERYPRWRDNCQRAEEELRKRLRSS